MPHPRVIAYKLLSFPAAPGCHKKPSSRADESTACGPAVAWNFVSVVYGQMRPDASNWLAGGCEGSSLRYAHTGCELVTSVRGGKESMNTRTLPWWWLIIIRSRYSNNVTVYFNVSFSTVINCKYSAALSEKIVSHPCIKLRRGGGMAAALRSEAVLSPGLRFLRVD